MTAKDANVDVAALKERFWAELKSTQDRLNRINDDLHRTGGPLPADFAEQAVAVENDETLERLREDLGARLVDIRGALQRIDAGGYGVCVRCHEPIPAARLEAVPSADLCLDCAPGA